MHADGWHHGQVRAPGNQRRRQGRDYDSDGFHRFRPTNFLRRVRMTKSKVHWFPALNIREMSVHPRERAVHWYGCRIEIERTPGQLGGWRTWFVCPECRKHFAILRASGDRVACRQCLGLAYQCQSETANDRLLRRADKLRKRLGWQPGVINPSGGRPKYMRWDTFVRLRLECLTISNQVLTNYSTWVKSHSGLRRCE
jgi:hypothetical protein